ncbi:nucleotidyltransferase family protein [Mesoterricola sediminis]|uniref:Nucleotidyl transferase domain-containing protein n=1 Tax=Mesoterricola sediminis TaxID=2927980 RepID=A0AA48KCF4_9BACT|nr:nucleotidyltransferase family protein [Mesoterricola sediminis]BDU75292.1 hypothetical protein METESE_02500 [Mesoterricola sediminis]
MHIFVLCGGFGTRLAHIVKDVPKPMAPIEGLPFLEILLEHLVRNGATSFTLLTGHKAEVIEDHFSSHPRFAPLVTFSRETAPLGTAGALREALKTRKVPGPFAIANGDTFFDCSLDRLRRAHEQSGACLTIALKYCMDCSRYGRVRMSEALVTGFLEKQANGGDGLINAGLYFCSESIASFLPESTPASLEDGVFPELAARGLLGGVPFEGRFIDIGVESDYRLAQANLQKWIATPKRRAALVSSSLLQPQAWPAASASLLHEFLTQLQERASLIVPLLHGASNAGVASASHPTFRGRLNLAAPLHIPGAVRGGGADRQPSPEVAAILQAAEDLNLDLAGCVHLLGLPSERLGVPGLAECLLPGPGDGDLAALSTTLETLRSGLDRGSLPSAGAVPPGYGSAQPFNA